MYQNGGPLNENSYCPAQFDQRVVNCCDRQSTARKSQQRNATKK